MRTLGLIGGMSWESTVGYYTLINRGVREQLGPLHSAQILLHSVDFAPIAQLQREDRWQEAGAVLAAAARGLEAAGAQALVLCANTMHCVADQIQAASALPFLHVADAIAVPVLQRGLHRVGLLGTRYTMSKPFLKQRLAEACGLEVLVPDAPAQEQVHAIIYEELCAGLVREPSRAQFRGAMAGLVARGAQAIVLACTEISLLVGPEDATVPLLDTLALHVDRAVQFALGPDYRTAPPRL